MSSSNPIDWMDGVVLCVYKQPPLPSIGNLEQVKVEIDGKQVVLEITSLAGTVRVIIIPYHSQSSIAKLYTLHL